MATERLVVIRPGIDVVDRYLLVVEDGTFLISTVRTANGFPIKMTSIVLPREAVVSWFGEEAILRLEAEEAGDEVSQSVH